MHVVTWPSHHLNVKKSETLFRLHTNFVAYSGKERIHLFIICKKYISVHFTHIFQLSYL